MFITCYQTEKNSVGTLATDCRLVHQIFNKVGMPTMQWKHTSTNA